MKHIYLLIAMGWICCLNSLQAQTTTNKIDADWTDNGDWTGTAPDYDSNQSATIAHNSTVNGNPIVINNGHTLIINAGIVLSTDETITVKEGGTLIVNGEISGTDGGKEIKIEKGTLTVNAGGSIDWAGGWVSDDNPVTITINGDVAIGGDMSNKVTIDGGGSIDVSGTLNNDGGSIFGCTLSSDRCCTGSGCSLPIDLLSFDAIYNNGFVYLQWTTATELDNDFFTVERLAQNDKWLIVAELDGAGTSSAVRHYQHVDRKPPHGTQYYRLKQTDFDGSFTYSSIISANSLSGNFKLTYYPNPVHDKFYIEYAGFEYNEIFLTDNKGQHVDVPIIEKPGNIQIDVTAISRGIYLVYIKNELDIQRIKLIVY